MTTDNGPIVSTTPTKRGARPLGLTTTAVALQTSDLDRLDAAAAARCISRTQLIREIVHKAAVRLPTPKVTGGGIAA